MHRSIAKALTALALVLAVPCQAGTLLQTAKLAGYARQWLVHLPPHYKRGQPLPLVVLYHGEKGTPQGIESNAHLDALADRMDFIVVYPAGVEQSWASHNATDADAAKIDDVAFTAALLDQLELKYSVDPQRVVLAGLGQGAQMVNVLGCRLADRISGIVAVTGTLSPASAKDCQPSRALTVIEFHASADPFVPFAGGPGPKGGGNGMGVEANIAAWAGRDHCESTPHKSLLPGTREFPPAQVEDFGACPTGTQVRLYEIMGTWHVWPSGQPVDASLIIGELAVTRKVD